MKTSLPHYLSCFQILMCILNTQIPRVKSQCSDLPVLRNSYDKLFENRIRPYLPTYSVTLWKSRKICKAWFSFTKSVFTHYQYTVSISVLINYFLYIDFTMCRHWYMSAKPLVFTNSHFKCFVIIYTFHYSAYKNPFKK